MPKIKICGITNYEDALNAVKLGASYIGLNFYKKSPRYIKENDAKKIVGKLPKNVKKVGVFVNENLKTIKKIVDNIDLDIIQLHGSENPNYCQKLKKETKKEIIKAFRIKNGIKINEIRSKIKKYYVDYYMFDTYKKGMFGGTGKTFNWNILDIKSLKKKFFLSGGLNSENVKEAIKIAKPFAVDVSSSVEEKPGKKDYKKMKEFISIVKKIFVKED